METLSMVTCFTGAGNPTPSSTRFLSRTPTSFPHFHKSKRTTIRAGSDISEEDVLQVFFEERKLNGDFISKASDILWQREVLKFEDANDDRFTDTSQQVLVVENDDDGGFLKLASTQAWISGGNSAPINKKAGNKAAISYAVGALSRIGVRSEDIKNAFEKSVKGSGIALSSPRLVIPAAIYALWIISHKYLANDFFDFQLTPAMLGMFVYKAAALIQVYRDNENLKLDFPEN